MVFYGGGLSLIERQGEFLGRSWSLRPSAAHISAISLPPSVNPLLPRLIRIGRLVTWYPLECHVGSAEAPNLLPHSDPYVNEWTGDF